MRLDFFVTLAGLFNIIRRVILTINGIVVEINGIVARYLQLITRAIYEINN